MSSRPTILVTGGAGYIGSHCCRALDAAGYQPIIYDNLSTGHRSFAAGALVVGDIADKATLARTFVEHDIVAVMHFAASSLVGESVVTSTPLAPIPPAASASCARSKPTSSRAP